MEATLKNQLLMLWMLNISDQSKLDPQLKLSMLFSILVQVIFGYHQKNVGAQHVSYIKLMIAANHHHTKLMVLKLILLMDQDQLKELPQLMMLLLTD
jgi:hypothetical protein